MGNVQAQERKDVESWNNYYGKSEWCTEITTPNLTVLLSSDSKRVIVAYQINPTDVIELRASGVETKVAKEIVEFGKSLYCFSMRNKSDEDEKPTCTLFLNDSNGATHQGGYVELSIARHLEKECDQNSNTVTTNVSDDISSECEKPSPEITYDQFYNTDRNTGKKLNMSNMGTKVTKDFSVKLSGSSVPTNPENAAPVSQLHRTKDYYEDTLPNSGETTPFDAIAMHVSEHDKIVPPVNNIMLSPFLYNRKQMATSSKKLKKTNIRGKQAWYSLTNWLGGSTAPEQIIMTSGGIEFKELQPDPSSDTDTDRTLTLSAEFENDIEKTVEQCITKLANDDSEILVQNTFNTVIPQTEEHEEPVEDIEKDLIQNEKHEKNPRTDTWLAFVSSLKYKKPTQCADNDLKKLDTIDENTNLTIYS